MLIILISCDNIQFNNAQDAFKFCTSYVNTYMTEISNSCKDYFINTAQIVPHHCVLPEVNVVITPAGPKFQPIICIPKMNYYLFHLPKTAGRYIGNNFCILKASELWGGSHPTFNASQSKNCKILNLMDCATFPSSHGVAVLRNPFSWLTSFFSTNENLGFVNFKKDYPKLTFEVFIESICVGNKLGQKISRSVYPFCEGLISPIFDIEKKLCIENFIFFEKMTEGMSELKIAKKIENCWNYHKKPDLNKFRPPTLVKDYRFLYNNKMIDMINSRFKFELDFGGYDFNGLIHEKNILKKEIKIYEF